MTFTFPSVGLKGDRLFALAARHCCALLCNPCRGFLTMKPDQTFFACRRCGERLFDQSTVSHDMHQKKSSADECTSISDVKTDWAVNDVGPRAKCTSVFLNSPPPWLECTDSNEGRLVCPKCDARVGNFRWSGSTCSCGKWVTPSFQFQLARVDPKRPIVFSPQSTSHRI